MIIFLVRFEAHIFSDEKVRNGFKSTGTLPHLWGMSSGSFRRKNKVSSLRVTNIILKLFGSSSKKIII